jgi:hypothetical protein
VTTFLDALLDGRRCMRPTDENDNNPGPAMAVCGDTIVGVMRYCPACEKRLLVPVKPIIRKAKRAA